MNRISVKDARQAPAIGSTGVVQGWVRTRRDSKGGFSFIEVNDGSSQANVQILVEAELANYDAEVKKLTTGSSIRVEGAVQKSPAKGQATEVKATKIEVY